MSSLFANIGKVDAYGPDGAMTDAHELSGRMLGASIGVFDGVHKGHKAVLSRLVKECALAGAIPVAIVFSSNPKDSFRDGGQMDLMTVAQRRKALLASGVRYVAEIDFDDNVRKMSGRDFLSRLFRDNVSFLVVGKDFKCGNSSSSMGTSQMLHDYPGRVVVVDDVTFEGIRISSTLLRGIIRQKGSLNADDARKYGFWLPV